MNKTVVAAVMVLACCCVEAAPKAVPAERKPMQGPRVEQRGPVKRASAVAPRRSPQGARRVHVPKMPPQERRLLEAIDEAEGRELLALLPQARLSPNPVIREAMVDALEDKGRKFVNEIVYFIGDADEDVADAAFSAWTSILEDLPAPLRRNAILEAAVRLQPPPAPVVTPAPVSVTP